VLGKLDQQTVLAAFDELTAAAKRQLAEDELDESNAQFDFAVDLRYRGQEHSIPVPLATPDALTNGDASVHETFNALHDMRYGHAASDETIEVANLRMTVTLPREGSSIDAFLAEPFVPEEARPEQTRKVVYDDPEHPLDARILWRPSLAPGFTCEGPAIIEEPNSTITVFPGDVVRVTEHGHLVISIKLEQGESV